VAKRRRRFRDRPVAQSEPFRDIGDTNAVVKAIRPFVVGRRNWLSRAVLEEPRPARCSSASSKRLVLKAKDPNFERSESPYLIGELVAVLAAAPDVMEISGQALGSGYLSRRYGVVDTDRRPSQ
jgi:hypothetical protein